MIELFIRVSYRLVKKFEIQQEPDEAKVKSFIFIEIKRSSE